MKILVILNEPPYGNERCYNGLRMTLALGKKSAEITVFLMADAVFCAKRGQTLPEGYYSLERMLKAALRSGEVLLCGACMDARGLTADEVLAGARRSSMDELSERTLGADKVLVF